MTTKILFTSILYQFCGNYFEIKVLIYVQMLLSISILYLWKVQFGSVNGMARETKVDAVMVTLRCNKHSVEP